MLNALNWLLPYLKDPRIWQTVTPLLGAIGWKIDDATQANIMLVLAGISGLVALFTSIQKDIEAKRLQEKLGMEKKDGVLGPNTQGVVEALVRTTPDAKMAKIMAENDPPKPE